MQAKPAVYVTVTGRPMSGMTTLMKLFIETLQSHNIEVEPRWGIDGEPNQIPPEIQQKKLNAIANKTKVVISEHHARRGADPDEPSQVRVQVLYEKERGYGTRLIIAGQPLESWFGDFSVSKERARTVAARLGAEFDIEVEDKIPREYEWRQPQ